MSYNIAVAGKGGTGKTTIASLIIRYLLKNHLVPVLAVDADANANLGESLGLEVRQTVGKILAEFQGEKIRIPPGMTKQNYLEYRLNEAVVESQGFDLITMGRGEGQECYCYPNTVLKKFVDGLADNYAYLVMDNEAGMEHLSRGTTRNIDELLIISDHSVKGVRTIARIRDLVSEIKLPVKRQSVIINSVPDKLDDFVSRELDTMGIVPVAILPRDDTVYRHDLALKPLLELPDNSKAVMVINDLMTNILK